MAIATFPSTSPDYKPVPIINPIRTWNRFNLPTRMRSAARGDQKASRKPPVEPNHDFTGQNVIVTGANTGLGYQAALKFASLGAQKLILGVRNMEKGEIAKLNIIESLGLTGDLNQIEVWPLDMLSYLSIKTFAAKANKSLERLDIVVLNAGIMPPAPSVNPYSFRRKSGYKTSQYGWEETLQVNTLSTVYLALLLLPKLRETSATVNPAPVLEFVGCSVYKDITLPPAFVRTPIQTCSKNELANKTGNERDESLSIWKENKMVRRLKKEGLKLEDIYTYKGKEQYDISKYALQCAVRKIAEFVGPHEVVVISCCPQECKTDIRRQALRYNKAGFTIKSALDPRRHLRTSEQGARTLVSGTYQGRESHGMFWTNDQVQAFSKKKWVGYDCPDYLIDDTMIGFPLKKKRVPISRYRTRTKSVEEQKEGLLKEGKLVSEFEQIELVWKDILFCLAKDEPEVQHLVKAV
ncbi:short-chain dehydrogenase [Venturia nashicola]|uniref:Short-chain dehydrogenase n=1 Tax=Venturia nashicola TaxID=86259 RepID=A0A4Z1NSC1_9PEZI|nr:short-chain dehydrogenase [Venturia nashicola]TLD28145.1 short-chain dehydrogenase [Venturia nashicola]